MANPPEEQKEQKEQNKKKKYGCFGCLWIIFSLFLLLLASITGYFYWQDVKVTSWTLRLYSQRVAAVMTSSEHYLIWEDEEYVTRVKGKEKSVNFDPKSEADKILEMRRQELLDVLNPMVDAYLASPDESWQESLKILDLELQKMLEDKKISYQTEFQKFKTVVKKITEQHIAKTSEKGKGSQTEEGTNKQEGANKESPK